jgi:hypothetical protein
MKEERKRDDAFFDRCQLFCECNVFFLFIYPYRAIAGQELKPADYPRRLHLCLPTT